MNLYLRSVKLRGLGGGPDESRSRGVHRNDRVKYAPGHAGTGGTMVQETRLDRPRIVPMIAYEDAAAAIDWLGRAFGFRERGERYTESDGRVSHAELEFEGSPVFLATPTRDYESPKHHRQTCAAAKKWSAVAWVVARCLRIRSCVQQHLHDGQIPVRGRFVERGVIRLTPDVRIATGGQ